MKEIQEHKIKIYEFPETDDEEEMKMVRKIKVRSPKAFSHELLSITFSVVFRDFGFISFMLCSFVC